MFIDFFGEHSFSSNAVNASYFRGKEKRSPMTWPGVPRSNQCGELLQLPPSGSLGLSGGISKATSTVRAQSSGRAIKKPLGQAENRLFSKWCSCDATPTCWVEGWGKGFYLHGLEQVHLVMYINI